MREIRLHAGAAEHTRDVTKIEVISKGVRAGTDWIRVVQQLDVRMKRHRRMVVSLPLRLRTFSRGCLHRSLIHAIAKEDAQEFHAHLRRSGTGSRHDRLQVEDVHMAVRLQNVT